MSVSAVSFVRRAVARLVFVAALVLVATLGAVLLARLAPGGAAVELYGTGATRAEYDAAQADDVRLRGAGDVARQWFVNVATLDFGASQKFRRPVLPLVAERAARTASLVLLAFVLAVALGVGVATATAARPGPWPRVIRVCAIALQSCPPLLLAILLSWLAWRSGWQAAAIGATGAAGWLLTAAVPTLALALPLAARLERAHARVFVETRRTPVMTALRARGLAAASLRWRHALRLSAPPLIGIASALGGSLLGGSLAVELITAWPGLGRLAYEAFTSRDTPLMAGCAAAAALFVGVANALGDAAIVLVDPRVESVDDPRGRP
ncbi:MAG: ABC transporter permease subunit [Acidobacteria bacterium]|nr:ABC transporter permease subunit [Acidobacteriota bacterium]